MELTVSGGEITARLPKSDKPRHGLHWRYTASSQKKHLLGLNGANCYPCSLRPQLGAGSTGFRVNTDHSARGTK